MNTAVPARSYQSHKCQSSIGRSIPMCSRARMLLPTASACH